MRIILFISALLSSISAFADQPVPWQMGFQESVTPVMDRIVDLHNLLMVIITGIVLFVLALLAYVCIRFNKRANPVPQTFSHNVLIEVVWTVIPVIILFIIAVPSFRTLYYMERIENADMTVKVVGNQWYWSYEYPDHGDFGFDSNMLQSESLKPAELRLLEVDNRVVIPENTTVRFLITASDVIHSFTVPAFGIKMDAVPGRVNETWVKVRKPGVYYGQCSELCGINHGFMPIAVEVVTKQEFAEWAAKAKEKFN